MMRSPYRYIDALCASGVPVLAESGHRGGYRLPASFTEAPLFFAPDEQKALIHAAKFAREAGYPYGDALDRAVAKLEQFADDEQRDDIRRHAVGFDVIIPPADETLASFVREPETSVADSRTLQIGYQKPNETAVKTRRIDPYDLVYWKSRWYVVAYCHLRGEIRSFRADRIRTLQRTEETFQRPPGFSARQFFLSRILPEQNDACVTVHLQGTPRAIRDLCLQWPFAHTLADRDEHEAGSGSTRRRSARICLICYCRTGNRSACWILPCCGNGWGRSPRNCWPIIGCIERRCRFIRGSLFRSIRSSLCRSIPIAGPSGSRQGTPCGRLAAGSSGHVYMYTDILGAEKIGR